MESRFNRRFLDNIEQTMNGFVYKNQEAFDSKGDNVCYISEYGLNDLEKQDHELSDQEIIEHGIGESYKSILGQCVYMLDNLNKTTDESLTPEEWAADAFDTADWQYISTLLFEWTF